MEEVKGCRWRSGRGRVWATTFVNSIAIQQQIVLFTRGNNCICKCKIVIPPTQPPTQSSSMIIMSYQCVVEMIQISSDPWYKCTHRCSPRRTCPHSQRLCCTEEWNWCKHGDCCRETCLLGSQVEKALHPSLQWRHKLKKEEKYKRTT